jgi:hypothetical protein
VVTQLKTYALNQTIFLRDQVLAEAGRGNYKPLAYLTSVFPVAGELLADIRSIASDDPGRTKLEHPLERLASNMLAVGGFSLAGDMMRASLQGRLADMVMGPTITDGIQFTENLFSQDWEEIGRQFVHQPLTRIPITIGKYAYKVGAVGNKELRELYDTWETADQEVGMDTALPTFGDLRKRGY